MQRELFFQIGFFTIATSVLAMVCTGCVFWFRRFRGTSQRNLCGDLSPDLITRLPRPIPRWSVAEFLLMFGLSLLVGTLLQDQVSKRFQPAAVGVVDQSPQDEPRQQSATPIDAPVDSVQDDSVQDDSVLNPGASDSAAAEGSGETPAGQKQPQLIWRVRAHFLANLIALSVTLVFLRLVHGATLRHLGLIPNRLDLRRGMVATVWILTPVLLINVILANLVQYEHPVTDLLALKSSAGTFVELFLSAAIVTPVVEEFEFRLLLQGGLQQLADPPTPEQDGNVWRPTARWPIYLSSAVFALLHFGQGAAPIALFFFSVGLGFLYQRTGRLVPVIFIHMFLNGATLCMEFCRVNAGL